MTQRDDGVLEISLSAEEHKEIKAIAQKPGYENLNDYVHTLIELDIFKRVDNFLVEEDDEINPVLSFEEAWHQMKTGQTYPIEQLWEELDKEE